MTLKKSLSSLLGGGSLRITFYNILKYSLKGFQVHTASFRHYGIQFSFTISYYYIFLDKRVFC